MVLTALKVTMTKCIVRLPKSLRPEPKNSRKRLKVALKLLLKLEELAGNLISTRHNTDVNPTLSLIWASGGIGSIKLSRSPRKVTMLTLSLDQNRIMLKIYCLPTRWTTQT